MLQSLCTNLNQINVTVDWDGLQILEFFRRTTLPMKIFLHHNFFLANIRGLVKKIHIMSRPLTSIKFMFGALEAFQAIIFICMGTQNGSQLELILFTL